jgi:hypothetical protein
MRVWGTTRTKSNTCETLSLLFTLILSIISRFFTHLSTLEMLAPDRIFKILLALHSICQQSYKASMS